MRVTNAKLLGNYTFGAMTILDQIWRTFVPKWCGANFLPSALFIDAVHGQFNNFLSLS